MDKLIEAIAGIINNGMAFMYAAMVYVMVGPCKKLAKRIGRWIGEGFLEDYANMIMSKIKDLINNMIESNNELIRIERGHDIRALEETLLESHHELRDSIKKDLVHVQNNKKFADQGVKDITISATEALLKASAQLSEMLEKSKRLENGE